MGLFTSSKSERAAAAADWTERAERAEEDAQRARGTIARHRQFLAEGSSDPAADRYMIKQAEGDLRVAEAKAKDYRDTAKRLQRRF